ncbi:MAG: phosphotransferase [Burkholderiaceae bacterium]|nr:phosphotransferase [Microbacteriaceae bacterium]
MARSPLTLAALATSAVAGLDVTSAQRLGSGQPGSFEQAVLQVRGGGEVLVRVPRTQLADTRASTGLVALRALSTGIRARLPFSISSVLGQVPVGGTRAIVYDFLPGTVTALSDIHAGDGLAGSIGRAIAAIHALPTSFVADAALPVSRPLDALASSVAVMEQSVATGLVPAALVDRWERATEDPGLWQFVPTVVHGSLAGERVLRDGETVTAILGWETLAVADPATDLSWVLGAAAAEASDSVFDAYNRARGSTDRQIKKRAMLYAELEIAKWLLHGTSTRSTETVDDAVRMLHNLVDVVQNDLNRSIDTNTSPVMTVDEVETMLDRNERSS